MWLKRLCALQHRNCLLKLNLLLDVISIKRKLMKIKEVENSRVKGFWAEKIGECGSCTIRWSSTITLSLLNPSQIKAVRRYSTYANRFRQENSINNNGPDGNKKFKKSKTRVSLSATKWIKPLLLQVSSRRCTRYMVSLSRRQKKYHAWWE